MLQTKLVVPNISRNIVARKKIEQKLNNLSQFKIILVAAPAGYGKTTSVAHYLLNRSQKFAWYTLDKTDDVPEKFWRSLMVSVAMAVKDYGFLDILINKELIQSNFVTKIFLNMLKNILTDITLVLDDYHHINDETIKNSLLFFMQNLPENINVILISRKTHDNLALYEFKNSVMKIGVNELAFSFYETQEFFDTKAIYLKESETAYLQKRTEGWVTGLFISSLYLEKTKDVYSSLSSDNEHLIQFFKNEIFDQWSDAFKELLIQTSFLETVTGQLCYKITGNEKSQDILKVLSHTNCFVFSIDQNDGYVYHTLFKEFLFSKFSYLDSKRRGDLYYRAGEWYCENRNPHEALKHFIKGEKFEEALELIAEYYQGTSLHEYQRVLEMLPKEVLENCASLCATYTCILCVRNQMDNVDYWVNKAEECFAKNKDLLSKEKRESLEAKITAAHLCIAIQKQDVNLGDKYLRRVLELNFFNQSDNADINPGEISMLNTMFGFRGSLSLVDKFYEKYLDMLPAALGDASSYLAVMLAESQYERNELQTVYKTLADYMGSITRHKIPGAVVPCIILLAKIKLAKGNVSEAFELVESGRSLLTEKDSIWMQFYDLFTAYLYICKGEPDKAESYLDIDNLSIFESITDLNEYQYIVFARYLIHNNQLDETLLLLGHLEEFARREKRVRSLIEVLILKTVTHYLRGESLEAMLVFDMALNLGASDGYIRLFIQEGQIMSALLAKYKTWEKSRGELKNQRYIRMLCDCLTDVSRIIRIYDQEDGTAVGCESGTYLLSARELEVLQLLGSEYSNAEIADELFITERTVKHHNARIYQKLGVKNRLEAILKAKEIRLIS